MSETRNPAGDAAPGNPVAGELPAGSEALEQALLEATDETGATITTDTVGVASGRTGGTAPGAGTDSARGATSGDTAGGGAAPGATTAGRGAVAED